MHPSAIDEFKKLHTAAIDARNGYAEASEDAQGRALGGLFKELMALHTANASELEQILVNEGEEPDDEGSFMSVVNKTVMGVRALFGGLDQRVLPGLIDGEERIIGRYDEALKTIVEPEDFAGLLANQRERLVAKVASMKAQHAPVAQTRADGGEAPTGR